VVDTWAAAAIVLGDLAARAMSGWRRSGQGHHPAGLNFGDCFTYALAERTGHPVLCTGNDFATTDIAVLHPEQASAGG
jgi:ribonuclease VapC